MAQSIFTSQTPAQTNLTDATAYTLGTCFFPGIDGQITGIRWYGPGTAPTGTVTAGLYSITDESTGTLLASANFSSITPGVWNQVLFSSPVSVLANTHYVAAVLTPNRYIVTTDFFDAAALTNGDLTAIQQGVPFANGRLHVGATLAFPESGGGGSNFFVDVVFDTGAGGGTVEGTAAAALGGLTATATGTRRVSGTSAGSLGSLTATAAGQRTVTGTFAAPLGGLAATVSGQRTVHGQASTALGGLTATIVVVAAGIRAESTSTVSATRTSASTITTARTSTSTVTAPRTSTSTVTGG